MAAGAKFASATVPSSINSDCYTVLSITSTRRDGRVVEGARLESVYRGNSIEGSNPSLSAIIFRMPERLSYGRRSLQRFNLGNGIPSPGTLGARIPSVRFLSALEARYSA